MLLVPRQLQRAGMTGDVPYYGGRLTPAQAYAVSHPAPRPGPAPAPHPAQLTENLTALQSLLDNNVIDQREFDELRTRVLG